MPQVELGGPFKGINEIENEQVAGEFDFLLNAEMHDGVLKPRAGFSVMGKAYTDATETGGDYSTAHNIVASSYSPTMAYKSRAYCVGAFPCRLDSGILQFVSLWRQHNGTSTWSIIFKVYDEVGDPVGSEVNLTSVYGEPADGARPYIFTEYCDRVIFSNGNGIFVWNTYGGSQLDLATFVQHPIYGSSFVWVTSRLRPRLVSTHKDRVFYASFPEDMLVSFSANIGSADDTAPFQADGPTASRPALKNGVGGQALFFPSQVMWSEPNFPQCVRASSFWVVPDGQAITAMAEYREHFIVWTQNSMYSLSLDTDNNVEARKISSGNGCVSQRSVVTTNGGLLIWASRDGIQTFDGEKITDISRRISRTYHGTHVCPFPRQDSDVRAVLADCRLPANIDLERLEWASGADFRVQSQYWLAVPTKQSEAPNGLIIVYDYDNDRFWFHASRETDSGSSTKHGIAGWDVLMSDPSVNDVLYACTRSFAGYTSTDNDRLARYSGQLCSTGGAWDESVSSTGTRLQTRIPFLAVGGRQLMLEPEKFGGAVAKLRMFATHNHDFVPDADAEWLKLIAFTEGAAFDQWRANSNRLEEQSQRVSCWPEPGGSGHGAGTLGTPSSWRGRYFWQPASTDTSFNVWDNGTLDSTVYPTLKWLGDEVCEKVVPIPFYPGRWTRLCLYYSPLTMEPKVRLLSWGVVVRTVGREDKA